MSVDEFRNYWFGNTGIVLLANSPEVDDERGWETDVLGTYYVSDHIDGAQVVHKIDFIDQAKLHRVSS